MSIELTPQEIYELLSGVFSVFSQAGDGGGETLYSRRVFAVACHGQGDGEIVIRSRGQG